MIYKIFQDLELLFKKNNFKVLLFHNLQDKRNKFCFDFLVKKNSLFYLIKVFPNIDNLNEYVIENIKILCRLLNCKPVLIGIKNRYQHLDDNTIYIREGLPFISNNTIHTVLNNNIYPYCLSRKGGKITFLNGELMKTLREQKDISRSELSEKLGVTKRTICSYENENLRPSNEIAEEILEILEDTSIIKKINIFEWRFEIDFDKEDPTKKRELTDFELHLKDLFDDIGIATIWYKKGQVPFEFSICSKNFFLNFNDEFYPLFSGLSQNNAKIDDTMLNHLQSFAKIFHKDALFIVNNDFKISDIFNRIGVPVIKLKDLEKMDTEKDFVELFEES